MNKVLRFFALALAVFLSGPIWAAAHDEATQPPSTAVPNLPPGVAEIEVTVGSGAWAVPGILSVPAGQNGRVPVAVLMHGFGPGTLDGDVGPNKVMRETAHGLARRGVATLRFAKRTTTHRRRFQEERRHATLGEEWLDDAVAAVALLRSTADVDPARIYIVGHSASGGMAPLVANLSGAAGAVMVNGSMRDAATMIEDQMNYVSSLSPRSSPEAQQQRSEMLNGLRLLRDPNAAGETQALGHPLWYWRSLARLNVVDEVRALTARGGEVFVAQGARDYLTTEADWAVLEQALGAEPGVAFRRFDRLNHMMQEGEGRMTPAEYQWRKPVALGWTEALAEWIASRPVPVRSN